MSAERVMLLTGCASGIGLKMAQTLAPKGHKLLLSDVNEKALWAQARQSGWEGSDQIVLRSLDVRSAIEWDSAIEDVVGRWGRLDVLMNIAGYLKPGWVHEISADEVALHLDVNAKGVILGTMAAARQMVGQHAGHIVNMGSLAAIAPTPGIALYSASKFAVRGFSLAAASELRRHGVFVTLVCPDAVQTPMLDLQKDRKEAALTFSGPRALSAEEVVRAILEEALPKKPLELVVEPPRSGRGLTAKIVGAFPDLATRAAPLLSKRGRRAQRSSKER